MKNRSTFFTFFLSFAIILATAFLLWKTGTYHRSKAADLAVPRLCLNLGTSYANLSDIELRLDDPSTEHYLTGFSSLTTDSQGRLILDLVNQTQIDGFNMSEVTATIHAPGRIVRKVPSVSSKSLTCTALPDTKPLVVGDFNGDNAITIADLITAVRAHNGGTDTQAQTATHVFNRQPTIADLVTLIRGLNQTPNGDTYTDPPTPRLLTSFETTSDVQAATPLNADISRTSQHATNGDQALLMSLHAVTYPQFYETFSTPQDWSGYGGITFDITNLSGSSININLRIDDQTCASTSSCRYAGTSVAAGNSTTVYTSLTPIDTSTFGITALPSQPGVVSASGGGSINPAHITKFTIYGYQVTAPQDIVIDNIRLVAAPTLGKIVDTYGQYANSTWDSKVTQDSDLATKISTEAADIAAHPTLSDRDQYGGMNNGPQQTVTGYFYTTQVNGTWWLVDPLGHLFFSTGLDTITNKESTVTQDRESLFQWLPKTTDPFGNHYGSATPIKGISGTHQTFNFYAANLERRYGNNWDSVWQNLTLSRLTSWGFNTLGNWTDSSLFAHNQTPYVLAQAINGSFNHVYTGNDWWGPMPDPFDPTFAQAATSRFQASISQSNINDPNLIGYYVDNELSWVGQGTNSTYGIAIGTLKQDSASSPAKQAFISQLQSQYTTISSLNTAWGTSFASWAALSAPVTLDQATLSTTEKQDCGTFIHEDARTYFQVVSTALKTRDPHHLYLGARFAGQTPSLISTAAAEFADVVSYNVYTPAIDESSWSFQTLGKPVMIGEFQFGTVDGRMFSGGLKPVADQAARGTAYLTYARSAEDNSAIIGYQWFQYVDEPLTGRSLDGEAANIGFVDITDTPYPALVEAARTANSELYTRRHP